MSLRGGGGGGSGYYGSGMGGIGDHAELADLPEPDMAGPVTGAVVSDEWTALDRLTAGLNRALLILAAVAVVACVFAAGLLVGMELHDSKIVLVDDPVVSTPPTTPPVPFRP